MAKKEYKVVAPMVYLQFRDQTGATVQSAFYQGAVVFREDDDDESVGSITEKSIEHHLETEQILPADDEVAEAVGPAGSPIPGDDPAADQGLPQEPTARTRKIREAVTGKSVEDQLKEKQEAQERERKDSEGR